MFSLSTSVTLHHVTYLPAGTTREQILTQLHNHDLLIRLDPELAHYEGLPELPSAPKTKRYKVTDHMHTLPKGLWDTTVTFEAEMTDTEEGIEWVIKAPLGLVQTTTWRVVATGEAKTSGEVNGDIQGEWSLVEDVEIKANRMLVGTVKGKCEENWRGIHSRFAAHLKGEQDVSTST